MADDPYDYLVNLMEKNVSGFLNILNRNVVKGDNAAEDTLKQLAIISSHPRCQQLLCDFRDTSGDGLIHNVAKFHRSTDVLKSLLSICPKLVLLQRSDRFLGQTALHIVVTKMNLKAARCMIKCVATEGELHTLLHTRATGSLFSNTVMMGELVLSVAALSLNTSMVDLLVKNRADLSGQNSRGDTVFHSLIRYASIHQEKMDAIIKMIEHINSKLPANLVSLVWYNTTNEDDLTALKLAAALGQVQIFNSILKLEDVYCKLNHHDGLFDIYLFDITEIDTITQAEWERNKKRESESADKLSTLKLHAKKKPAAESHQPALIHRCPAVLDIICRLPTALAFDLLSVDVVRDLIDTKWKHYRHFYYLWFLCHFLVLLLITIYAVFKTKVINEHVFSSSSSSSTNTSLPSAPDVYETTGQNDVFVFVVSVICVLYAAPYLVYEAFRSFYFRQYWHLGIIHHNGLYRLMMVAMSFTLIADTVWFWVEPDNNYFLVLALLIGWTFMNFFLRALKIFSFFTVMLQKVLLGDMTRFSVIIIFQLVAFSVGMYITFLNTRPVPEGFDNIGRATMTMFKLMLGLTEFEVLYEARHPWLAIFLFVACVLVTYVLLINSLIALMSQTCALVSEDRRMQWELQRLSVIHLVETMLLPRWRYLHKPGLKARRYNVYNQATEWRCFSEITSLQTTYTDGAAIFRRKSMIRTIGFGDTGLSPLTPFIDRFRSGRHSSIRTIPIYQNPASLRDGGHVIAEEEENDSDSDREVFSPDNRKASSPASQEVITPVEARARGDEELYSQASSGDHDQGLDVIESQRPSRVKDGSLLLTKERKQSKESASESAKSSNFLTVVTSPRKRHNSETVNRKTQTSASQTGHLSHSYPDGRLRAPLQGQDDPDSKARIVYVVPTSLMNQQLSHLRLGRSSDNDVTTGRESDAELGFSRLPDLQFGPQASNISDHVQARNVVQHTPPASAEQQRINADQGRHALQAVWDKRKDNDFMTRTKRGQENTTPPGKVQTLDIDTLHDTHA